MKTRTYVKTLACWRRIALLILALGLPIFSPQITQASPRTINGGAVRGDFDSNSWVDYTLQNLSTHKTAIWLLTSNTLLQGMVGPSLPAGWFVVTVIDMNADGQQDFVLFNPTSRQTAVWYMQGNEILNAVFGPTLPPGWRLRDAVDANGDLHPDFVLTYAGNTTRTAFWYLTGTSPITVAHSAFGPTLPAGWTLVAALDFNINVTSAVDYLLVNNSTRQTAIWYLDNTTVMSTAYGPTLPSGWTCEGAADLNHDTKPDLVLYNASTRQTAFWYLNGPAFVSSVFGPTLASGYTLAYP